MWTRRIDTHTALQGMMSLVECVRCKDAGFCVHVETYVGME